MHTLYHGVYIQKPGHKAGGFQIPYPTSIPVVNITPASHPRYLSSQHPTPVHIYYSLPGCNVYATLSDCDLFIPGSTHIPLTSS